MTQADETKAASERAYVAGGVYDPPDEAWPTKGRDAELPEGLRRERKGPLPRQAHAGGKRDEKA